jgi:hypothetical protein
VDDCSIELMAMKSSISSQLISAHLGTTVKVCVQLQFW